MVRGPSGVDEMSGNEDLVKALETLLRACREDRIIRRDISNLMTNDGTAILQMSVQFRKETEFSGLSSLVKSACAIDLAERLKIAAQVPTDKDGR